MYGVPPSECKGRVSMCVSTCLRRACARAELERTIVHLDPPYTHTPLPLLDDAPAASEFSSDYGPLLPTLAPFSSGPDEIRSYFEL